MIPNFDSQVVKYFGLVIENPLDSLNNLRFADDVLLVGQNCRDIRAIMDHLQALAAKYGLKLSMDETKVLITTH